MTRNPPLRQADAFDGAGDDPGAVAADFVAPVGQQFGRRHPVPGEEALHVRRGGVARMPGVQGQDLAAGAGQDQRG